MPDPNATPESRILINGTEIAVEMQADVLELVVSQHVEGGDAFAITLNMLGSATPGLKWVDAEELGPGNRITVQLGYRGELQTVLDGEITALKPSFEADDAARLSVQGFDQLHRLRRGRKTRVFKELKDSQIAEQIAGELGLTARVRDTAVVHRYLVQNNLSDIDFLLMRARRIRYELMIAEGELIFREAPNNLQETIALEYQRDLKRFCPRLTTAPQTSRVTVRGWNPATKEPILGIGQAGDETTRMGGRESGPALAEAAFRASTEAFVQVPVYSQAEADQMAKALFNDMALELTTGDGEAVGNPDVAAGVTIRLDGLGTRFSGLYYVRRAEHRIGPRIGYVTRFNVSRNAA